jgi:mevalonate kinase
MNHSLLCTLGVSHPSLNAITNLTESLYEELQCSTKLTGAGGGGCAFTFLEDDVGNSAPVNDNDEIDNRCGLTNIEERLKVISDKIEALKCDKMKNDDKKDNDAVEIQKNPWSFQCFTSAVGGKGVLWL